MQIINVKPDDFDYTKNFEVDYCESLFGIREQALIQLYYFYKNHSSKCLYVIEGFTGSEICKSEYFALYSLYGVFTGLSEVDYTNEYHRIIISIPADVMTDEISLQTYVNGKIASAGEGIYNLLIEKDYEYLSKEEQHRDYMLMSSVYPNFTVINPNFSYFGKIFYNSVEEELNNYIDSQKHIKFVSLCVDDLLNEQSFLDNMVYTMPKVKMLSDNIIKAVNEKAKECNVRRNNIIVFVNRFSSDREKHIYLAVAAYLIMSSGIHCYVERGDRAVYLEYVRRTTSRQYNYLSDYLRILNNFPNFLISYSGESASLCIKNLDRIREDKRRPVNDRRYSVKISVYPIKIDINNFTFVDDIQMRKVMVAYEEIKALDFRNYFDLTNTDDSVCKMQYEQLNTILIDFGKRIREKSEILNDVSLNCNNVLLFEVNGSCFLGYVSDIEYKLPFYMTPFATNYKMSMHTFDLSHFSSLYDTNIIFDASIYVDKVVESNPQLGKNLHFDLRGTAINGSIMSGIRAKGEKFEKCEPLSFSDLGIWSVQTSQLRKYNNLLKMMNINSLIKNKYVGYYGGLHPAVSTDMVISPSLWR